MTDTAHERQAGEGEVWLTRKQAARRLQISERTLERYQARGLIEPYWTPGGDRRWKPDEVDALLTRRIEEIESAVAGALADDEEETDA